MLMMSRWVALSVCFVVVVVELDMALCSERRSTYALFDYFEPPVWDGFCKATVDVLAGYECQEYQVKGKDGFILGVSRIPHGRSGSGSGGKRPAVIVQHGVMVDSLSWMLGSTEQSLVVALADSGFDVWVSNTRGTRFSSGHESLDEHQPEYWDWSWQEVAENDLPALVDFVAQQTGQKVHYVGHSMGTLTAMVALSQGLLANQLLSAALLSPIAYMDRMTFGIGQISANVFLGEISELGWTGTMFVSNWFPVWLLSISVGVQFVAGPYLKIGRLVGMTTYAPGEFIGLFKFVPQGRIAYNIAEVISRQTGIDLNQAWTSFIAENCCVNGSAWLKFLNYGVQPSSMKNMVHFSQTFRDGVLAKYDYGSEMQNIQHYGQPKPPSYNLANIPRNVPLFLSYGSNDQLADVQDVERLLNDLRYHDKDKLTPSFVKGYGHIDYMMGHNVREMVYNPVVNFLRLHTPGLNHRYGNRCTGHVGRKTHRGHKAHKAHKGHKGHKGHKSHKAHVSQEF